MLTVSRQVVKVANEIRHYTVHVDIEFGPDYSTDGTVIYIESMKLKNRQHLVYLTIVCSLYNKPNLSMCLFLSTWIKFYPAWISYNMPSNVWDGIDYPFPNSMVANHTLYNVYDYGGHNYLSLLGLKSIPCIKRGLCNPVISELAVHQLYHPGKWFM